MDSYLYRILAALLAWGLTANPAGATAADEPDSAQACLRPATWTAFDGKDARIVTSTDVLADMAKRDVVLLGERHDQHDDHLWQVQALSALQALRPNMVIGFEMFPRRVQPVLDRWVKGELTAKQFLEQSDWEKVWNVSADLYMPLFQFARINRIPMVALNVDPKLNKAILEKGWDQVPEAEREGIGRAASPTDDYKDFLLKVYGMHSPMLQKHEGTPDRADPSFVHFVESQITWDRAMAEALAQQVSKGSKAEKPLVVGIMGSGHIRFGHGVPHQLQDLGIKHIGTLLPMGPDSDCSSIRTGLADAVFALPQRATAQPEPPRLGVRLEQTGEGVRIAEVMADSLAEKSGLKSGDHLVEIGGQPAKNVMPVTASIRQQPGGSWLPLRIKRGEETFEVVVKFPAKP